MQSLNKIMVSCISKRKKTSRVGLGRAEDGATATGSPSEAMASMPRSEDWTSCQGHCQARARAAAGGWDYPRGSEGQEDVMQLEESE